MAIGFTLRNRMRVEALGAKAAIGRIITITSVLILLCTALSACIGAGAGDWKYVLPNGYVMVRLNSRNILIGQNHEYTIDSQNGIEAHIIEFCFNDRYVCAQQVDVTEDLDKPVNKDNPRYLILDTLNQEVIGPFTDIDAYDRELIRLEVTDLCDWIATSPAPKGAIFG